MALVAPKGSKERKFVEQPNIPAGVYPGRLVQIIDFGLQPQRPYKGADKPPAPEIGLTYELVDTFLIDEEGKEIEDKPRWVSETLPFYGLYADKAKSTQRYLAFDPNQDWGGNFAQAITLPVNITIVNNKVGDKVYDNVASISPMRPRDAEKCPELKNPPKVFDLDNPDKAVFEAFPEWIREKIKSNLNFAGSPLQKLVGGRVEEPAKQVDKVEEAPWEDTPANQDNPY